VFEIAKTASGYASTPTTLVTFNGSNGETPVAGLIADAAGDLFGTTQAGGANDIGTVFELTETGFQVSCFMAGTKVRKPKGVVAVEMLRRGDLVSTVDEHGVPLIHRAINSGVRMIRPDRCPGEQPGQRDGHPRRLCGTPDQFPADAPRPPRELRIDADQIGAPISARAIARAVATLGEDALAPPEAFAQSGGAVHLASSGDTSAWFRRRDRRGSRGAALPQRADWGSAFSHHGPQGTATPASTSPCCVEFSAKGCELGALGLAELGPVARKAIFANVSKISQLCGDSHGTESRSGQPAPVGGLQNKGYPKQSRKRQFGRGQNRDAMDD